VPAQKVMVGVETHTAQCPVFLSSIFGMSPCRPWPLVPA